MNETKQQVLQSINVLYDNLLNIKDINEVDELRLILIKHKIEEAQKIIDDFGKKMYEGLK